MIREKISRQYFKRREALMKANPGAVFILPGQEMVGRNADVTFRFRQDSDFYYLTAFDEPNAFLVITPNKSKASRESRMILFVQSRDPKKELWTGEFYGVERAKEYFGADEVYPIDDLVKKLPEYFSGAGKVFYNLKRSQKNDRLFLIALDSYKRQQGRTGYGLLPVFNLSEAVGELRVIKSRDEINIIKESCAISAKAHLQLMKEIKPGMGEFDVVALLESEFKKRGCWSAAFTSIAACGKNATCLHYTSYESKLQKDKLITVDGGGEFNYYASDITRTYPVAKEFTPEQEAVYSLVLKAQKNAIKLAKPGVRFETIHEKTVDIIIDGALSLGLLKGNIKKIKKDNLFKRLFPHSTGHWMGLDVHDSGIYKDKKNGLSRKLEPGMVFTVEPGIYIQPNDTDSPKEYRGIGVRIEDDILVTNSGALVLTKEVPKELDEICKIRAKAY